MDELHEAYDVDVAKLNRLAARSAERAEKLKAENEKLKGLVSSMMRFFEDGDWCTECDHARECDAQEQYEDDCLMRFVFRDRMAQLGVEADG